MRGLHLHSRLGSFRLVDARELSDEDRELVVGTFERRAALRAWLEDQSTLSTMEVERLGDALGLQSIPAGLSERLDALDGAFERLSTLGSWTLVRTQSIPMVAAPPEAEGESHAPEPEKTDLFEAQVFWRPGKPIVNTWVSLVSPEGRSLARGQTDAEGWARFPGKYPADCTIECLSLPIAFNRTLHLRFIGADRHSPMVDEEVKFEEFGEPLSAKTDDTGVIRVTGLSDHYYYVEIAGHKLYVPSVELGGAVVKVVVERKPIEIETHMLEDASEATNHDEELYEDDELDLDHIHGHAAEELSQDVLEDDHPPPAVDDDDDGGVWPDHLRPGWAP